MKSTVDLIACSLFDPNTNSVFKPPTDTATQVFTFKHGVGQLFRVRSQVVVQSAITSSTFSGSEFVRLGPFWTTPSSPYYLSEVVVAVTTPFTTSGSITNISLEANIGLVSASPALNLVWCSPLGTLSGGAYSVTNSNKIRATMGSNAGLVTLASTGKGTDDFVSLGASVSLGDPAGGAFFQGYGATTLNAPFYVYLFSNSAWSLLSGTFVVNIAGFLTT